MKTEIKLGDLAKDAISGFTGVVVCRSEWLNGCVRLTLQPRTMYEGKPVEQWTFDVEQLVKVKGGKGFRPTVEPSGGDRLSPTRNRDPR